MARGFCKQCGQELTPDGLCPACGDRSPTMLDHPVVQPPTTLQPGTPPWPSPPQWTGQQQWPLQPPPWPEPPPEPAPTRRSAASVLFTVGITLVAAAVLGLTAWQLVTPDSWAQKQLRGGGTVAESGSTTTTRARTTTTPKQVTTTRTSRGAILYSNDLSTPSPDWVTLELQQDRMGYENGAYAISTLTTNRQTWAYPAKSFDDFSLEVSVTPAQGSPPCKMGILFRYKGTGDMYRFMISSTGSYVFEKAVAGAWTAFVGWEPSAAILTGGATNRIQATCRGELLAISANGVELGTFRDGSFGSGDIGLVGGSFDEPNTKVYFRNLRVYAVH